MNQDNLERMVKEGGGMADILQSVPEEKRGIVRMLIDTYINGFLARERLETKRDSA